MLVGRFAYRKNLLKYIMNHTLTHIMTYALSKIFTRNTLTNLFHSAVIATACLGMSALTLAKPPIAPPSEITLLSDSPDSPKSNLVSGCLGDLDSDGQIDTSDLAIMLGSFGCSTNCTSDLNTNGNVGSEDLGILLTLFGVCPAPTVTAISPDSGLASGGTTIIIYGTNFNDACSVTVGGIAATNVYVVSATVLTAVTPAGNIGLLASVSVTAPGGIGALAGAFSYYDASSPLWASVIEVLPNPAVVTDSAVRAKIVASGMPWRVQDNITGIEMLLVPAGVFQMGASLGDSEAYLSEKPAHQVTISKAFYLGKTEVTQAQWQTNMGSNPSYFQSPTDTSRPVEQLSWNEIQVFNNVTRLRLPTEAEWEYACRGGTTTARYGDTGTVAWYDQNSNFTTHPVGGKPANSYGLYDMLGNVEEWCNDWYGSYTAGNATDPMGPRSGSGRVLRGGSWSSYIDGCRSSDRLPHGPDHRSDVQGFRVARSP